MQHAYILCQYPGCEKSAIYDSFNGFGIWCNEHNHQLVSNPMIDTELHNDTCTYPGCVLSILLDPNDESCMMCAIHKSTKDECVMKPILNSESRKGICKYPGCILPGLFGPDVYSGFRCEYHRLNTDVPNIQIYKLNSEIIIRSKYRISNKKIIPTISCDYPGCWRYPMNNNVRCKFHVPNPQSWLCKYNKCQREAIYGTFDKPNSWCKYHKSSTDKSFHYISQNIKPSVRNLAKKCRRIRHDTVFGLDKASN